MAQITKNSRILKTGFTLIELIIVIAVIAVLASVVLATINPAKRFASARNIQRQSDALSILSTIKTNQNDNAGAFTATITALTAGQYSVIGTNTTDCNTGCNAKTTQNSCINLSALQTAGYLPSIPFDPSTGSTAFSDYYLSKNAVGVIEIGACDAELSKSISVAR